MLEKNEEKCLKKIMNKNKKFLNNFIENFFLRESKEFQVVQKRLKNGQN